MQISEERNSMIIDGMAFGFSAALLLACIAGAAYTRTFRSLPADFFRILTSPGPLITDYFMIGSMPAAFLNSGLCGLTMALFMHKLKGYSAFFSSYRTASTGSISSTCCLAFLPRSYT